MLDNIGGGIGRLPSEPTRKRMAQLVDSLPPWQRPQAPPVVLSAAVLDRYVGEYQTRSGTVFAFRRDGATLFVKQGNGSERPLVARSETRFTDPEGPVFDFELDAQGKVTGALLERSSQSFIRLVRK